MDGVATQLETAKVPEKHMVKLLGHEMKAMSYGLYLGGLTLSVLADAAKPFGLVNVKT